MAISDEELVQKLESMPLVDPGDLREPVMARIRVAPRGQGAAVLRFKPRLYLGLAWAAAVALVIGLTFFKAPPAHDVSATMVAPEITVDHNGDTWIVHPGVQGRLEWDQTRLRKIDTFPDGSIVLKRVEGATGTAEIRLHAAGREVATTTISLE